MNIKTAGQSFQDVTFDDDSFDHLLEHLEQSSTDEAYHLSLFIGKMDEKKEDALRQILDVTGREVNEVDANEIISKTESETYSNLDLFFKKFDAENSILYLKNGSRLCGVYTGNTQSRVKYATPQERYFLKKVQESGGLFIIDIDTSTDADTTIRRVAQSVVNFPPSQSMFKKIIRKLKGVSVHGYQIKTERPEQYGGSAGNF